MADELIDEIMAHMSRPLRADYLDTDTRVLESPLVAALYTPEVRRKLAKKGAAMPDGSYPIQNRSDLKRAVQSFGRSGPSESKKRRVKRHIIQSAKRLGAPEVVPDAWKSAAVIDPASGMDALFAALELALDAEEKSQPVGPRFRIPVLVPVSTELQDRLTGDNRSFAANSLTTRDLPVALMWQIETDDGHKNSVLVGRVDSVEKLQDGSLGDAYGVFDTGEHAQEAVRLIRAGMLRGVSADLDEFDAKVLSQPDEDRITQPRVEVTKARLMAVTLVPKPAFQESTIELVGEGSDVSDHTEQDVALTAAALLAAAAPVHPPAAWFAESEPDGPCALTVTDEGQVYGHLALYDVDHIGMPFGTKAPKSPSDYAYFNTGTVKCDDGTEVHVGQLTAAGGHANLSLSADGAVQHYDETKSAWADVHAVDGRHGIWITGAIRPGVTPELLRTVRASALSGDWRPIRRGLELVAALSVNVPGFPVARAQVAGGQVCALVAAGTAPLVAMVRDRITLAETTDSSNLAARLAALEAREEARESAVRRSHERAAVLASLESAAAPLRAQQELAAQALAVANRVSVMRDPATAELAARASVAARVLSEARDPEGAALAKAEREALDKLKSLGIQDLRKPPTEELAEVAGAPVAEPVDPEYAFSDLPTELQGLLQRAADALENTGTESAQTLLAFIGGEGALTVEGVMGIVDSVFKAAPADPAPASSDDTGSSGSDAAGSGASGGGAPNSQPALDAFNALGPSVASADPDLSSVGTWLQAAVNFESAGNAKHASKSLGQASDALTTAGSAATDPDTQQAIGGVLAAVQTAQQALDPSSANPDPAGDSGASSADNMDS